MKIYRGSATAARNYVEADRSRADDYYLSESDGFAARLEARGNGAVASLGVLDGDAYEAWVAGFDPVTGVARGRLRTDDRGVRFAEVVVNGPKSWSLAAEAHPGVGVALEAAQDRAVEAIVGWFGTHATTRVGPRGGQVAVPVERVEAVAVRHWTNRAGDPHRHVHLQINARVEAAGAWRGLDTAAVRDSTAAVNGIGHAAVVSDPGFRAALAAAGLSLDPVTGEIEQLLPFVGAFSKRAEQIERQIQGYETVWRIEHPGQTPGPGLARVWDARAWAEHRPAKGTPAPAGEAHEAWLGELYRLGYTPPARAVPVGGITAGTVDREAAAGEVVARLGAARSGWNHPEIRGEAELLLARTLLVAEAGVRAELVEDITARALGLCVPLLERPVPEHIRAWTSAAVLEVENDLTGRLAVRGALDGPAADPAVVAAATRASGRDLDPAQAAAVGALAGDAPLVLVTGAAGAGKTTTLATARDVLAGQGQQMRVVTPTLRAAKVAAAELGTAAGSAAALAHAHGWRWEDTGWTRLDVGQLDPRTGRTFTGPPPEQALRRGDLLVVDEAGMLDQDTARALLTIADEAGARVALVGDPHQLPAVGRGGVLEIAARWAGPGVDLDVIHRFTRAMEIAPGIIGTVPDREYAALTRAMRHGAVGDPAAVFDQLRDRGQVAVHPDPDALRQAVAAHAVEAVLAGRPAAVSAATNEAVEALNAAVRERLVQAGHVDDLDVAITAAGQRVGVGDLVVTRANDRDLDVANRDAWTVTRLGVDGSVTLTPTAGRTGPVGERETVRVLPREYVVQHVQLGYAATVHGVQGATAHTGHLVLDEHTTAAGAYVGMTRGRQANTVHLVASDLAAARDRWVQVSGHERADTGIAAARAAAVQAAERYPAQAAPAGEPDLFVQRLAAGLQPVAVGPGLEQLAAGLHQAWTAHAEAEAELARAAQRLAAAETWREQRAAADARLAESAARLAEARRQAETLAPHAAAAAHQIGERTQQLGGQIHGAWAREYEPARAAAADWLAGPGRFGLNQRRVDRAEDTLQQWARNWRHLYPHLDTTDTTALARQGNMHPASHDRHTRGPFQTKVTEQVRAELPDAHDILTAARTANAHAEQAAGDHQHLRSRLAVSGGAPPGLAGLDHHDPARAVQQARTLHDRARTVSAGTRAHAGELHQQARTHPDLPHPAAWLATQRAGWQQARTLATAAARSVARTARAAERFIDNSPPYRAPERGHDGPSLGL